MSAPPPLRRVRWTQAWRIVSSRFPPTGLFDRIADPADLDAVFAIESLTNPRLRAEVGTLSMVPRERRISGPGSTPVMAAFTHLNPMGSRFSDGTWGVFYAARTVATAIEETVFHCEAFMRATKEPPTDMQMRCYTTSIVAQLHDIRGGWPEEQSPSSYAASVTLARELRAAGSDGIVYESARHAGGQCVAAFYPDVVSPCTQAQHLAYRWDGTRVSMVFELTPVKRPKPA